MSNNCFGICYLEEQKEELITNLSIFSFFIRGRVKELLLASSKEIVAKSPDTSVFDMKIESDLLNKIDFEVYVVGIKEHNHACLIYTTEPPPHNHLIYMSKFILSRGLKETIEGNFEYIKTDEKIKTITKELEELKMQMINNINILMKRRESLEDLLDKTEHLTGESKNFYKKSKKLNKRCCFFFR